MPYEYKPYVDEVEYLIKMVGNSPNSPKQSPPIVPYLIKASRHIDALTYNRIVGNFSKLTEFQQTIIKQVCCELATWEYENSEMLNSVFKGYSINGVNMEFGGNSFEIICGVAIPKELYQTLCQTGLCCRAIG